MRHLEIIVVVLSLVLVSSVAEAQCAPGVPCIVVQAPAAQLAPPLDPELSPARQIQVERTRPRWGLVIGGAVTLVAAYALNVVGSLFWYSTAIFTGQSGDYMGWSLVPLVGPLAQMGYLQGADWQIPVLAVIGAAQIAGLVMAIVGTASRETVLDDAFAEAPLAIAPYATESGGGVNVIGTW